MTELAIAIFLATIVGFTLALVASKKGQVKDKDVKIFAAILTVAGLVGIALFLGAYSLIGHVEVILHWR